jgi:ComF family protein
MRSVLRAALNLLFPARCPSCQAFTDHVGLCQPCTRELRHVEPPLCPICGLPFPGYARDHRCPTCRARRRRFVRDRASFFYQRGPDADTGALARVLHDFKYRRDVTLAPVLADLLIRRCPLAVTHDLIVPVPLHRDRLRWRGFNQSLLLARRLGARFTVPVDPFTLVRTRPTPPQVGLDEADRRRNVAGAFAVARTAAVAGHNALLVDDVYTTGATVEECARILKRAGARHVDVLVLARVV